MTIQFTDTQGRKLKLKDTRKCKLLKYENRIEVEINAPLSYTGAIVYIDTSKQVMT
jgi:hypothetical protein